METGNFISADLLIEGTVSGSGPVAVEGRIIGAVQVTGEVHVASNAELEASVDADDVRVEGTVRGAITAERNITLSSGARVEGDVTAPRVEIDPQARLVGRLDMKLDLPRGVGGRSASKRW